MVDSVYLSLTSDQQREDRTLRTLRTIVDSAGRMIAAGHLSRTEAADLSAQVRDAAGRIVPEQMDLYDMIYGSRFRYLIETFCSEG